MAQAAAVVLLMLATGSCSDANKQSSPVTLLVTTDQVLHTIDLSPGALNCNQEIGTVLMQAIQVQSSGSNLAPPSNPLQSPADLNVVKIDRYQVSYVRIDGGHLVPSPFVRSISTSLTPGGAGQSTSFVAFDPNALNQAPFAALLPQNGGIDPETGRRVITMDLVLTVFGQTLAGEKVSGNTRFSLDFCYSCGGCS
ncbi:MAG TPA: hypothetical protein VKH35_09295 [Thermoanaerobaculia bacterium]|nr:hypothetical protein [Thermoanaerobaculia bacterium]